MLTVATEIDKRAHNICHRYPYSRLANAASPMWSTEEATGYTADIMETGKAHTSSPSMLYAHNFLTNIPRMALTSLCRKSWNGSTC